MRLLNNFIKLLFSFIVMIPFFLVAMVVGLIDKDSGIKIIRKWIYLFIKLFNIQIVVENENEVEQDNAGNVFTLLNQTSLVDGLVGILTMPLPLRGLINFEYALIPFFGWFLAMVSYVIIRQLPKQAINTIDRTTQYLQNGGNMWLSIEGRRSKNGTLSSYKKGTVVLAIKAQVNIVPVIIVGAGNCIGLTVNTNEQKTIVIKFLEAIPTRGLNYKDRNAVVDQLYKIGTTELGRGNKA